jgi:hypothetical protein
MHVRIDQPGHQDPATAVDNLVTVGREALGNLPNTIVSTTTFRPTCNVSDSPSKIRADRNTILFFIPNDPRFFLPSSQASHSHDGVEELASGHDLRAGPGSGKILD